MDNNESYLEQLPEITDSFVADVVKQIKATPINAGRKELTRIHSVIDDIEYKEFKKVVNAKVKAIHLERQEKLQPIREAYEELRQQVLAKEQEERDERRNNIAKAYSDIDVNDLLQMFPTLLNKSTTKSQVKNFVDKYKQLKQQAKELEELKKSKATNITPQPKARSVNDVYIDVLQFVNDTMRDDIRSVTIDHNKIVLLVKN